MKTLGVALALSWWLGVSASAPDSYAEELVVSRLPSQHLAAHFAFSLGRTAALDGHYDLFPLTLGGLVSEYGLDELRLSLTQGLWRSGRWGLPPQPAAPTGALLYAAFRNESGLEERWAGLVEALSGHFCASLSGMTKALTAVPEKGVAPQGLLPDSFRPAKARLALAPRENLCTENLSPWKKLLPCKDTGLTTLLHPQRLFHSHFTSLSLVVRRVCAEPSQECRQPGWEAVMRLSVVFDAPAANQPLDWSLRSVFTSALPGVCPLADSSVVYADLTHAPDTVLNVASAEQVSLAGRKFLKVDLGAAMANASSPAAKEARNLGSVSKARASLGKVPPPFLGLHSFLGGSGQQDGRLFSRLIHRGAKPLKVIFSQMVPWYTRPFLHTLQWSCAPLDSDVSPRSRKPAFTIYKPGSDRERPHLFQLGLELPATSVCQVEVEMERALLGWTEYPPDAHRGFPMPPPVLHFAAPSQADFALPWAGRSALLSQGEAGGAWEGGWAELWGEVVLVSLPTPDFSMPYNVICLVCTVVALAFGPVHNLTTKSLVLISEEDFARKAPLFRLKRGLARLLRRLRLCPQRFWLAYGKDPDELDETQDDGDDRDDAEDKGREESEEDKGREESEEETQQDDDEEDQDENQDESEA